MHVSRVDVWMKFHTKKDNNPMSSFSPKRIVSYPPILVYIYILNINDVSYMYLLKCCHC